MRRERRLNCRFGYDSMSFSREAVLSALGQAFTSGMKFVELAEELDVRKKDQLRLRRLLTSMVTDGVIRRVGRAAYAVSAPSEIPSTVGRISVHPAGYGFVALDDGSDDVFIPAKYRGSAMDGDRVVVATWAGHKGTEGRVQEVVSRGRAKLTGTLRRTGRTMYLEPDDPRIATDYGRVHLLAGAIEGKVGEAVVVDISSYPSEEDPTISGRVIRVLGDPEDPRVEIEKIIVCGDIPTEFPEAARAQGEDTPQDLRADDFADRIDLRDREFVTIDPETARDFDDALCIEDGPRGGTRVWIAVADVSHYVRPDDALDREARLRGVSVYLPDRVIPMLPFPLSAGICSLNPEVDRCAMVARLDYDQNGSLTGKGFAAAVIRSHARLDYPGVAAALRGDFRGRRGVYRRWEPALERLSELAQQLRRRRMSRGALNLDLPEAKVVLDADDPMLVRDVVQAKGDEGVKGAYQLVEEFMIAANEAVGAFFEERGLTTVWRVHAPPEQSRVEDLAEMLAHFGIDVDVEEAIAPAGMSKVLDAVADLPAAKSLMFQVLRTLKQAIYDTAHIGHFGLASPDYLHFTSPIRRYPDVIVHRLLKHYLHAEGQASGGASALPPPAKDELKNMAGDASAAERRAMEAEREAVSMYRAFIMREQLGETFDARVTGVTSFGVFVEIEEPYVEGLIKIETLGDEFFHFDPIRMTLQGSRTGVRIGLGDELEVQLVKVSVAQRRIDFELVAHTVSAEATTAPPRRRRRTRDGKDQQRRAPAPRQARAGKPGGAKKREAAGARGTKRDGAGKKRRSGPGKKRRR